MAQANNGSEEPIIALLGNNNNQVVIDIDGKEEASSTQTSAPVATISFRRRHKKSLPKKQVSVGRNQETKVEEEEAAPPNPRGAVVVIGGAVDIGPEEAPIPVDAGSRQGDDNEEDNKEASPPPIQVEEAAAGGLPEQALMTIVGNYIERVGQIITLIGLGTITSTVGGVFSRGPPVLFRYIVDPDNENDNADDDNDALILYYKCLPAFFIVGVLELCYGIWVSRNQPLRAGKRAKTILVLSAILLIITVCFTGAGVNI